jgi:hypothetical protein
VIPLISGTGSSGTLSAASFAPASFVGLPLNDGIVPRDPGQAYATLTIAGTLTGAKSAWAEVYAQVVVGVTVLAEYSGVVTARAFSFTAQIPAVCTSHTLKIYGRSGAITALLAQVNNLCGGDIYLKDGQSNEVSVMQSGSTSANAEQSPWVRSFGWRTHDSTQLQLYPFWYTAEGDTSIAGSIGQWGLRCFNQLVTQTGIPVGVISTGVAGQAIDLFTRNASNPADLTTHCGAAYWRAQTASILNGVRCLFWYQGEANYDDTPASYLTKFTALRAGYLADYPNIDRIYVVQVRGSGTTAHFDFFEGQRQFSTLFPNLTVVPSNGLNATNGQHYNYLGGGYQLFGDWMKRLLARDRYGVTGQTDVTPLDVASAVYTTNKVTITLKTNDASAITADAGVESFFGVDASRTIATGGVAIVAGKIEITLNAGAGTPTKVWWWGAGGSQAWVKNAQGMGLLSFSIPVT